MKQYYSSTTDILVGLALVNTVSLGTLVWLMPGERARDFRSLLIGGCGLLFALLCLATVASLRQDRRRRQVEEGWRSSETRAGAVLETAVDAIISIDDRGTIESFNHAAERMLGYSRAEVIGKNVNLLMPSPEREVHDGYLARYRETGQKKIIGIGREVVCRRKDGSAFPADLAVGEYTEANRRKFTGFLRDISDRRRAEAQIREQAALLDKARDVIIVRDLEDRITYWNRAAERLYGWTAAEACGQTCRELLFRGDGAQLDPARRAVLNSGEWEGELCKTTREGRTVIVESSWSLLRDRQNRPAEILAIEADVTEKKKRERHALRAQRLESIGTLAGGIAHDLNNMLTPIMMSANLLEKERPASERAGLLSNIRASAERGAEMVKQLLSFAGGAESERTRIELCSIVDEIKSLLDHTLPKSIAIRTEVATDLWPVSGNVTQLSQVLMNLCVNARDAMPTGGVLTISAANFTVDDEFASTAPEIHPGPHVCLTISDMGSGIPPEVIDRVFDPFFTTKEHGKGTGLGLSTVLGIVSSHNGLVRVQSVSGRGTRFEIYLPAFESQQIEMLPLIRPAQAAAGGQLILVVDDESLILAAVKATLEDAGYRVLTAGSGNEAARLLCEHVNDVRAAIVDMMMPGSDGPTTMRALHEISPRLRMVANSGLRLPDEGASLASAFLSKPYTDEQLLTTLANVLQVPA
ncbi:MAG: PAS domain-containing hybrid sensor histidine kinase/response regulator [Planctomycetaceae bacterium]